MHYNIPYLIFGLAVTFAVPFGLLFIGIKWAEYNDEQSKKQKTHK